MKPSTPLVFAAVSLLAPSLRAQGAPDAVAEALFRDGRALMAEHRYPEACGKLAESQRLDPHIGTLLNLAACRALEGRTATAWAAYSEARAQATRAGRADHETFAAEQLRTLEPRLARVQISAVRPPAGLVLSLDGQALEIGALGTPLPVDPGPHRLAASAPGRAPWATSFDAREATTSELTLPALDAAVAATPAPAPLPRPTPAPAPPPAPREAPEAGSPAPGPLVWVLGGVAAAGVGVGSYFGVAAFIRNGDANGACPRNACTAAGLQADSDARASALTATVAFAIGGAAAATAALVWALGSGSHPTHVALTPASLQWSGAW